MAHVCSGIIWQLRLGCLFETLPVYQNYMTTVPQWQQQLRDILISRLLHNTLSGSTRPLQLQPLSMHNILFPLIDLIAMLITSAPISFQQM